ncbi:MAG: type II secretion system F family protein [Burkholderiaceae bacterium]|nr:type II secretion system F family protein [Burkholderiaceae bacterium]
MQHFLYEGRNRRGELVKGRIESPTTQAVAQWMMGSGIVPVKISADAVKGEQDSVLSRLKGRGKLTPTDLLLFTRQLGTMVRAGLPLMQALSGMQKSSGNLKLATLLGKLREDLDQGLELSQAMARHPEFFDDYYVSMIRVGEGAGRLDEVFSRLFAQLEFERDMRQKIKGALRYPTFVVIAIAIAVAILTIFVIPVFAKVYAGMKVELPLLTRILLAVSDFAVNWWWAVLAFLGACFYGFRLWVGQPAGRYRWDKFKLRLPLVGGIFNKAGIARFCQSFSIACKSGVPIDQAFTLVAKVVDNAFFERRIHGMREGITRGETMLQIAQASCIFQPMELQMISVGEATGEMEKMMEQVAQMYQEELQYEVSRLGDAIEPILLAVMGGLVLVLMLGIFLPLWDLGQLAQQG